MIAIPTELSAGANISASHVASPAARGTLRLATQERVKSTLTSETRPSVAAGGEPLAEAAEIGSNGHCPAPAQFPWRTPALLPSGSHPCPRQRASRPPEAGRSNDCRRTTSAGMRIGLSLGQAIRSMMRSPSIRLSSTTRSGFARRQGQGARAAGGHCGDQGPTGRAGPLGRSGFGLFAAQGE